MDKRENLLRAVRFERPEIIPATYHINPSCWHHYPSAALQDMMEAHPRFFPDFVRAADPIEPVYPDFLRSGESFVDPWGCVWETPDDGIIGAVIEHPLASWDAFDGYCPPDPDVMTHWGPIDWEAQATNVGPAISQASLSNGEIGHNHTWLKLTDLRGYQNAILDMADGEPRLFQLLEMLEHFNTGLVRNYIKYGHVEWLGFAEDLGMQQGPMLSPEHFRTYIKPSYQRLMQMARDADCIVHVHADGDLRALMEDLRECPIDVINLQDLVNGIDWIAEHLAGKLCIDLDIDRQHITVNGTPADIDALIRHEVQTLGSKQGGLMLTYGLYPGTPLRNAEAVIHAMETYSTYYA